MSSNNQSTRRAGKVAPALIAVIGVVAILIGGVGYFLFNATRPHPTIVERRDIVGYAALKGQIATPPDAYAEVKPAYNAQIDKIYTSLGAEVKKGDILVELANPNVTESYKQALDNVNAAESAYANAKKQYDNNISAYRKLVSAGSGSAQTTVSRTDTSAADGTTVTTTQTNPDAASAQQELDQAIAERAAGLISYQQQLDDARKIYRDVRAGKRMSQVRAPISGTIIALNAKVGELANHDNRPVAAIAKLDQLKVQAGMTPAQESYVKKDMPVSLTFDQIPNKEFTGRVKRIITQADPNSKTGTLRGAAYIAMISFDNTGGLVKPDYLANAAIKVGEVKNALAVPTEAIKLDESGHPTVQVVENGHSRVVPIEIGLSDGHYTAIKSGLNEGQIVQISTTLTEASMKIKKEITK